jgi:glycyl-tRNA synthetase beta chain
MPLPFLLEIGTEEIPDWMIAGALRNLMDLFKQHLALSGLVPTSVQVDATPRRLVLRAENLPERQPDDEIPVLGPPVSAGDRAALGFAQKNGVSVERLTVVTTPKGEYFQLLRKVQGVATAQILSQELPVIIGIIYWPKTMYWTGKGGPRFIRPIRWLVALLGGEVVPFEVAGVASGKVTTGHRSLGRKKITVSIKTYEDQLRQSFVLISAAERQKRIQTGINAVLPAGHDVKADKVLLDALTYLTEWPTPIIGSFDESYLALPREVLVTVMRHHQRYFSVLRPNGSLAPHFIAVMNIDADPDGLVRAGNERVLRARFNDARFFWEKDLERKLEDRLEDLKHVTFQAKLGSYYEKAQQVAALVSALGGSASAKRAALLCKCDLTTDMVKEFTELQGVMGGLYAKAQGEADAVADAIYHHYKPVSMEDSIPLTRDGCMVALADKLDTLRRCFGIGMVPTGSKDPFALRRAAQGVVKILVEGAIHQELRPLLENNAALEEFFEDRVRYYFRELRGYPYDEVNAAMAADWSRLWQLADRLEAVHVVRPTPNFEALATSFKRIRNILKQAQYAFGRQIDGQCFKLDAEKALYHELQHVESAAKQYLPNAQYVEFLRAVASTRPTLDRFFEQILVMDHDPQTRANRLELLSRINFQFNAIADFSEIVTSN